MKIKVSHKQGHSQKAFTLVELVLYLGITSVLLLIVSILGTSLLQSRIKNQAIAEVEQQGIQVMEIITRTIRNAENINSPGPNSSSATLNIDTVAGNTDPLIFDSNNGTIRMKEGIDPYIDLTNSRIIVSDLNFQNLSRPGTPGIIRMQFTLSHRNPSNRNEYSYQKTFTGSAALRHP